MKNFLFFFFVSLIFLVACTSQSPSVPNVSKSSQGLQGHSRIADPLWCQVDDDCACGGIDKNTGECFVGNLAYQREFVDVSHQCPDFCSGIAGNLVTKCVNNKCQNVPSETPGSSPEGAPEFIACTADAKICPDGTAVGRTGPNCEFIPCPNDSSQNGSAYLSDAHWQCEDGSWRVKPEDCFENSCVTKDDCQLMGVKGVCGPYLIAGPTKTLHKPPIFYSNKCGGDYCVEVIASCVDPKDEPRITGVDCEESRCVIRYEPSYY